MQPRGGIIQLSIPDIETLYRSYMPFVVGGGLFIPSKQQVQMGEDMLVLANLPNTTQKIPLTGKVVWISRKQNNLKPQGFGIQLTGEKGIYYKAEAEKMLTGLKASTHTSYTM